MGMDVHGKKPLTKRGIYFRNNIWSWRPLADYVREVAPQTAALCTAWYTNDGDGLDADNAFILAKALQNEINEGRTLAYQQHREAQIKAAPNEECYLCEGTGVRKAPPQTGAGKRATGGITCNACDGTGSVKPEIANYPFSVQNVQNFAYFLQDCGGFTID